jgi:hypothetical protein
MYVLGTEVLCAKNTSNLSVSVLVLCTKEDCIPMASFQYGHRYACILVISLSFGGLLVGFKVSKLSGSFTVH